MSVGSRSISGFLPLKHAGDETFPIGAPIEVLVTSVNAKANTLCLARDEERMGKVLTKPGTLVQTTLKPGMLVNVRVQNTITNGLFVSFLDVFSGTIDLAHLKRPHGDAWAESYVKKSLLLYPLYTLYTPL